MMLNLENPEDFVIATGKSYSLKEFVQAVFISCKLDWQEHVIIDPSLYRPSELLTGCADASKAKEKLGWEPISFMEEVFGKMVVSQLSL